MRLARRGAHDHRSSFPVAGGRARGARAGAGGGASGARPDGPPGRIAGRVHRTPVLTSRQVDALVGCRMFFKCELFQRGGAFKARGAFSRLTLLSPTERAGGGGAFSSGNHAQAVALAARELGMRATIVMPSDAPAIKVAATRGYGAQVVPYDRASGDREEMARRIVAEEGAVLVPPFGDD